MKNTLLLLLFFLATVSHSQRIITDRNAVVTFEASVPIFEPVAAKNNNAKGALNTRRGYISFEIPMKSFRFEKSLMEEHFNDNYLETSRYPKANFKGVIEKYNSDTLSNISKTYKIKGKITIHGKSKNITVTGKLKKTDKGIELLTEFSLKTDDFDIDIPYLIRDKIAKNAVININTVFN